MSSDMPTASPPALARLLLRVALGRDAYETVAGDLDEEFATETLSQLGRRRARRRYWALSLKSIVAHWTPGRRASRTEPRAPKFGALSQDVRYGFRQLRQHPGFSLAVTATLALGIAATTTVFGLINALMLQPLPYHEPSRVVFMLGWDTEVDEMRFNLDYQDAAELGDRVEAFTDVAVYRNWNANLSSGGLPERIQAYWVSANTFEVLGVDAALGRVFNAADLAAGDQNLVVLSHGLWTRRFGADPEIVGRTVTLDDFAYTVRGVMPPEFEFPVFNFKGDLWSLLAIPPAWTAGPRNASPSVVAVGRLAPEATLDGAQAAASTVMQEIAETYPDTNGNRGVRLTPMGDLGNEQIGAPFAVLAVAVLLVLIVACTNAANLQLARGLSRHGELAVRSALGASRWRIVRQLLLESAWLALAGGLLGAGLAWLALEGLRGSMPEFLASALPGINAIRLDSTALIFTVVVALLTVALFGLVPAWRAARPGLSDVLAAGGRGTADARRVWLRSSLVVAEVALSVALLVTTGLLVRTAQHFMSADPGFDKDRLLTFSLALSPVRYQTAADRLGFYQRLDERLQALPGVTTVGFVNTLPFSTSNSTLRFTIDGDPAPEGQLPVAGFRLVNPGYFEALGVRVSEGRDLTLADGNPTPGGQGPTGVLVNRALVRRHLGDRPALGRQLRIGTGAANPIPIVGVVEDFQHWTLSDASTPEVYLPYSLGPLATMSAAVRTDGDPEALIPLVRQEVAAVDPTQAIFAVAPMARLVDNSFLAQQMASSSLTIFSVSALLLTALGLHGVLAFLVGRRTREIGVRVALGASQSEVSRLVIKQSLRLVGLGLILGLVLAIVGAQGLASLLYGVGPLDLPSYALAAGVLMAVAGLASWRPTRRALKIDPIEALRVE